MLHPDELDMRIMRELESPASFRWNIRESYSSIAKKLGVDEETVGRRVERVRQAGILQGWELVVNPHLVSREGASIELEVVPGVSKDSVVEQLKLIDGVVSILNFSGRNLQVGLYYRNPKTLERQIALMESLTGSKGSTIWNVTFPPFQARMRRTDWLILDSLRKDPRVKLNDLAHEVKVSTRTLNRRIGMMIDGYAFFLHASIDLKKLGGLACRMLIVCNDPARKRAIDDEILQKLRRIEWVYTLSDNYSMFVVHCENTAETQEISSWVKEKRGFDLARLDIIDEQITVQDWLNEEIESRM